MTAVPAATWQGAPLDEWRARWRLPQLVAFHEVPSTNDVARTLASNGAPAGLLVMAEHQTAGRGSAGRTWVDQPGASLLLSFLLRPARARGETAAGTAPIRVGLAIARALRDSVGIDAMLKWPNDVVVPGAGKLAGVLCEAATAGGDATIIAGIGLNVGQRADEWSTALRGHATSIAAVMNRAPDRAGIMDAVIDAVRPLFTAPLAPLDARELDAYAEIDSLRGRAVTATGGSTTRGVSAGIAPDGALLLESDDGVSRITTATVRVVEPET